MAGQELFEALVQNTGLPEDYVRLRFTRLISAKGLCLEELDLDNVRDILSDLLLDLINQTDYTL